MPPTMGAAIRRMTSEPVPPPNMMGRRPATITATVIANRYLSGVRIEKHAALTAQAVFTAADLKTVQLHILPAKGYLPYVVKLRDAGVARHQQPSPNRQTDAA
jgi:hypothetical protein